MSRATGSAVQTSDGAPRASGDGAPTTSGDGAPTLRARMSDLLAYSSGSLGMGVWVTVPGLLLLYFMTHVLGVTPLLAGLTLLLPKILDAVVHPLLGTISDRHARRSGHRRGLLWWGLLLAVAMTAMFSVPAGLTGGGAALWIAGWYIAGNMLFACFQVPYLTTPSDLKIGYTNAPACSCSGCCCSPSACSAPASRPPRWWHPGLAATIRRWRSSSRG